MKTKEEKAAERKRKREAFPEGRICYKQKPDRWFICLEFYEGNGNLELRVRGKDLTKYAKIDEYGNENFFVPIEPRSALSFIHALAARYNAWASGMNAQAEKVSIVGLSPVTAHQPLPHTPPEKDPAPPSPDAEAR